MSARKLIYQGMVLGPVILIGFIGLGARAHKEEYSFVFLSPHQSATIGEYVDLMRASDSLPRSVLTSKDRDQVRKIGGQWMKKELAGRLDDVPSYQFETTVQSTVKSQIVYGQLDLVIALIKVAEFEEAAQNYDQAARDYVMVGVVAQVSETSDLRTLSMALRRGAMIYDRLDNLAPKLSKAAKKELSPVLASMHGKDERTIRYMLNAGKITRFDSRAMTTSSNGAQFTFEERTFAKACRNLIFEFEAYGRLASTLHLPASHFSVQEIAARLGNGNGEASLILARRNLPEKSIN